MFTSETCRKRQSRASIQGSFFTSEPDRRPENPRLTGSVRCLQALVVTNDPNTHSVKLRGLLDNSDGHILSDMYGTMVVTVNDGHQGLDCRPLGAAVQREEESICVRSGWPEGQYKRIQTNAGEN